MFPLRIAFRCRIPARSYATAAKSRRGTQVRVVRDSELVKIVQDPERVGTNWDYDVELSAFGNRIGFKLDTTEAKDLLRTAFTHKSVVIQKDSEDGVKSSEEPAHNERLALLGSTVTSHFVMEWLYVTYPNLPADGMRDIKSFLTDRDALSTVGENLGVKDLVLTQHKLYKKPEKHKVVSGALLAIVGALHYKQGSLYSRSFIHDFIVAQLAGQDLTRIVKLMHPKFMLRKLLEERRMEAPVAKLLSETGRATHMPTFVMGIFSGKTNLGEAAAPSLKQAEYEATCAALHKHFEKELRHAQLPSDYDDYVPEQKIEITQLVDKAEP